MSDPGHSHEPELAQADSLESSGGLLRWSPARCDSEPRLPRFASKPESTDASAMATSPRSSRAPGSPWPCVGVVRRPAGRRVSEPPVPWTFRRRTSNSAERPGRRFCFQFLGELTDQPDVIGLEVVSAESSNARQACAFGCSAEEPAPVWRSRVRALRTSPRRRACSACRYESPSAGERPQAVDRTTTPTRLAGNWHLRQRGLKPDSHECAFSIAADDRPPIRA